MLIDAGVSEGMTTHLFSRLGCGVLTLSHTNKSVGDECAVYARRTLAQIAREAKPGDILFLPSLRMPRLMLADGTLNPEGGRDADPISIASALAEAKETIEPLVASGLNVVISAPLPVFRTLPYRCSDWFNARNPICGMDSMTRAEIEAMRARVMVSLERLRERFPIVTIWDPTSVLCDAYTCPTKRDGKPLFFDGDHLTGWANDVLYPSFVEHIKGLATPISIGATAK